MENSEITDSEAREEAKRYLGDMVSDALDKVGVAALIKKHFPKCGCAGRRVRLNALHKRILGTDI